MRVLWLKATHCISYAELDPIALGGAMKLVAHDLRAESVNKPESKRQQVDCMA